MLGLASWPPLSWWAAVAKGSAARRRAVYVVAAVLGVSSLVALWVTDQILKALHTGGALSFGMADLADLGFHEPSVKTARLAFATWETGADQSAGLTGPFWLAVIYLVSDLVFIAAYGTIFGVGLKRAELQLSAPAPPAKSPAKARLNVAKWGFVFVGLFVIADLIEDTAAYLLVFDLDGRSWWVLPPPAEVTYWFLFLGALAKSALAILVLGAAAIAAGTLLLRRLEPPAGVSAEQARTDRRSALAGLVTTLATLRVQAVLVVVFGLFMLGPTAREQGADVMRRWSFSGDTFDLFSAIVLTAVFSVVTYAVGGRLLSKAAEPRDDAPLPAVAIIGGVLAVVGFLGLVFADKFEGLLVIGVIALVIWVTSLLTGPIDADKEPEAPGAGLGALPPLLSALPLVVLGIACLNAGLSELIYSGKGRFVFLSAVGICLQLAGWAWYAAVRRRLWNPRLSQAEDTPQESAIDWILLLVSLATAAGFAIWVWVNPWAAGRAVGVVGALNVFAILVSLVGYAALRVEQRFRPPSCFRVIGLKRIPVFGLAIVAFFAASAFDTGGYHDVRTMPYTGDGGGHPRLRYVEAWTRWRGAMQLQPRQRATRPNERVRVVPLIFIAAEGGGIRAAFWTARVLDCIYEPKPANCGTEDSSSPNPHADRAPPPFVESGVSGGSLGLIEYLAHTLGQVDDDDTDWVEERVGGDQLAATWAWTLFTDLPNALVRMDPDQDRAEVLEEAWERTWDDPEDRFSNPMRLGFFEVSGRDDRIPLLLMNGTSVQDGCRVNTSILDGDIDSLGPVREERLRDCLTLQAYERATAKRPVERAYWMFGATQDSSELLCGNRDVRLSTAALLSARFPFVTPAARVPHCGNPDLATFVVDGGYFDTSAASPIVELWTKLEPLVSNFNRATRTQCVVPLMLQIDNHYTEPRGVVKTRRPPELVVPLTAVRAARNAREHDARQTAALAFDGSFGPYARIMVGDEEIDRYAHIYPRTHPGTKAPLGWALSEASMDDLTKQLGSPPNAREFEKVAGWFDPKLRCERPPGRP